MDMPHHWSGFEALASLVCICLLFLYIAAAIIDKGYRKWPVRRIGFWAAGLAAALASLAGPLANRAHEDFAAHMAGHLLLGMLAPLLLLYAKPMTLILRVLPVPLARKLTKGLKSWPLQLLGNPATAAVLNIGGLYAIYLTGLFTAMHGSVWLYAFIHIHVLLAGYLFTLSILAQDIAPHRYGFVYRSAVLVLALAAHKILSKLIYANPPAGVGAKDAETGAMLMYYGGDAIDLVLIVLLCRQWYQAVSKKEKNAFT